MLRRHYVFDNIYDDMDGYRKELKFIVGEDILLDVANRISGLMRPDEHQKGDHYVIRSIYLDSPALTCYRENKAGVSAREKYRIRAYDCSDELILAEIKIRHRDTISKMSTPISRKLFDALISGEADRAEEKLLRLIGEAKEEKDSDPAGKSRQANKETEQRDGQKPVSGERFFSFFPADKAGKVRGLLSDGYYIPQEILNKTDYAV